MKHIFVLGICLLSALIVSSKSYSQDTFAISKDLYLGQKAPGIVAEPFSPGIVPSKGWELGEVHDQETL